VFLKRGAEFSNNPFDIVRRPCSESFGAEVLNANFCVARHSVGYPTKVLDGNTANPLISLMLCSLGADIHGSPAWRRGAVVLGCCTETRMPFVDTSSLNVVERLPGWYRRYFHSPSMTFAHYDFKRGSFIHEHFHPQEEVYEVIEGELEVTIDGTTQVARAGLVAVVPSNVRHSVKALTDGRAIIVDYPLRREFD
jgi:mannose-6-phosphate isomerase-like protein (cupin superfamily)